MWHLIVGLLLLVGVPIHAKFVLMTSLYNEKNVERLLEYIACIERNLEHPSIDTIHVMYDTSQDDATNTLYEYLKNKKVHITSIGERPSFGNFFDVATSLYHAKEIIVANADIFFNETLQELEGYDLSNKFLALTRWNVRRDGSVELFKQFNKQGKFNPETSYYSQDVWIFKAPLRRLNDQYTIKLGTWNCDSRIAFEAMQKGLVVINPCLTIKACHLHLSNVRHYQAVEIKRKYLRPVPWVTLDGHPYKE